MSSDESADSRPQTAKEVQPTIQPQVIALNMEAGVHQVIGGSKLVMLANSHDGEVFQMVVAIPVFCYTSSLKKTNS